MGILATQSVTFEARIAGRRVSHVVEVTSSGGFEQINSECTIWSTSRPSWADEGNTATVWASNGSLKGQIFGGEVTGFDWTYYPTKVGIVCQGILARVREAWGGDAYDYTEQDDAAIIRNLLEKKSIPSSVASIESSSWTLGVINPITLKEGDIPYSIIQEIDDLAGFKTYELLTGVIVRRRVSGVPGSSAALSYSRGVTILSAPRHNRTRAGIVNRAIVTGVEFEGLTVGGPGVGEAFAANAYVTDPSGYITENVQSDLVEDDPKALEIAARIVSDKNRRPETIEFAIPFDPRVQPGMTIGVSHPELEFSATVFCQSVSHSISASGAKTTIRGTGGSLTIVTTGIDPVASFDFQFFLEGEDTGSSVTALYVCIADGSTSFDPDGTIASYAWTAVPDAGTATPSSGSTAIYRFITEGASEVTVTLTVTDNDSNTNVLERVVPLTSSTAFVEDLYLAYGDVACSSDGEQSWRTATPASGDATCLAAFAPDWGEIWGTSTGHIYATFDKLLTALIDLGQPHGAIACTAVWVHETDDTRLWAGFSDGKVYYGELDLTGQTATWTQQGTIPDSPVVELRESYGAFNELRATAGAGYYYSTDGGASWTLVHTFDVAWRMAAGFDQNMATGLNTTPPIFGEDVTPTVPGGVTHLRGITFGWRTQALYAADNAANLYTTDSTFAAFTAHADDTAAQTNHMIRSGNIDGVIYLAEGDGTGNNGFQKWLPDAASPFWIRKTATDAGLMIGYGPAHLLPIALDLLLVRSNTGTAHNVYRYSHTSGAWTGIDGDLPSGKTWAGIAANPLDPGNEWIIWNETDIYRTTNAGTNWSAITGVGAYSQSLSGASVLRVKEIEFSPTVTHRWIAVGETFSFPNQYSFVTLCDGSSVTTDAAWFERGLSTFGPQGIPISVTFLPGTQFAVYVQQFPSPVTPRDGSWWVYFDTAMFSPSDVGSKYGGTGAAVTDSVRVIDALNTSGQVVGVTDADTTGLVFTTLSTTSEPSQVVDLTGVGNGAITNAGIFAGVEDGIWFATFSNPTSFSQVAQAGNKVLFIRADHTRRVGLGALINTVGGTTVNKVAISDGDTWSEISPPSGTFALWIEALAI